MMLGRPRWLPEQGQGGSSDTQGDRPQSCVLCRPGIRDQRCVSEVPSLTALAPGPDGRHPHTGPVGKPSH